MVEVRNGKKYAKKLCIFLGSQEYGSDLMKQVALEAFRNDPQQIIDVVEVYEHAGWHLSYLRDGTIVGTANDSARLDEKAREFLKDLWSYDIVNTIRRK